MHIPSQAKEKYKRGECTGPERHRESRAGERREGEALLLYLLLYVAMRNGDGARRSVEEVLIGWDLSRLHLTTIVHPRKGHTMNY